MSNKNRRTRSVFFSSVLEDRVESCLNNILQTIHPDDVVSVGVVVNTKEVNKTYFSITIIYAIS